MNRKTKLKIIQKLMGVAFILVSILILYITNKATISEFKDGTVALITIPLGCWFLFSKKVVIR